MFPDSFHSKLRDLLIKLTAVRRGSSSRRSSVSGGSGGGSDLDATSVVVEGTAPTGPVEVEDAANLSEEEESGPRMSGARMSGAGGRDITLSQAPLDSSQDAGVRVQSNVQKAPSARIKPPIARKPVTSEERVGDLECEDENGGTVGFSPLLNVLQEQLQLIGACLVSVFFFSIPLFSLFLSFSFFSLFLSFSFFFFPSLIHSFFSPPLSRSFYFSLAKRFISSTP